MKLYSESEEYKLYQGNMLDMLEVIEPDSIDSIITDPPYELNFMGKGWDNSGIAFQKTAWEKCFTVLKSGGYLLAFGGSRTFHRIACAIEDAGFEIRDTIMWLYGSGFPKSLNIGFAIDKKNGVDNRTGNLRTDGKGTDSGSNIYNANNGKNNMTKQFEERIAKNEWSGWGTALKPSFEPIIVARKPFASSLVDNVLKYSVGGLNIDECRVGNIGGVKKVIGCNGELEELDKGRFPANTILTYDDTDYDEVCGGMPADDGGPSSRYFYCAKASKKDRDEGLDEFEEKRKAGYGYDLGYQNAGEGMFKDRTTLKKNTHPTVKPTELMQYLVRLVSPNGATVLDVFNGSGSTGKAVMYENKERNKDYKYIGIELTEEYLPIAKARIEYAINDDENIFTIGKGESKEEYEQITLF